MENNHEKLLLRNNPFFVIGIASLLAIGMFTISFIAYYRSDTRKIIEQIQSNNLTDQPVDAVTNETKAGLTAEYIDTVEQSVTKEINAHSIDAEFNPDELTDSALGL